MLDQPVRVRRSLTPHAGPQRSPGEVLRRLAAWMPDDLADAGAGEAVDRLERRVAQLLGTQAALFFPTGTMAQQVALRVHAERRGRWAVAAHPASHLAVREEQGAAVVHGLRLHAVGDPNRLMTRADLAAVGEPLAAVLWELPQRDLGGELPGWHELTEQVAWARSCGAAVHLDGARLWEAQPAYGRPLAEVAGLFDTSYVSLYKGLGGLRGALLAGPADVLAESAVWRTRLGGTVPDAWPLAATALMGLDQLLPRMPEFVGHARALAAALVADGVVTVRPDPPATPMFHVHLPVPPEALDRAHRRLMETDGVQLFLRVRSAPDPGRCSVEITVGESALDFSGEEVAGLVRELVRSAAAEPVRRQ